MDLRAERPLVSLAAPACGQASCSNAARLSCSCTHLCRFSGGGELHCKHDGGDGEDYLSVVNDIADWKELCE